MSPRPQMDHIRRPQILDAAAEVIAERGIAATRIADVAERAGTSAPAVLYWFDKKEELLTEALAHEEERFRGQLVERIEGTAASQRLAILIDASCGGSEWRLWLELWTRALHDPEAGRTRRQLDRLWRDQIATTVEAGQREGEFASADACEVAAQLAAFLDGLAVQVALGDAEMPVERMSGLAREMAERLLACPLPAPDGYGDELLEAVV
ncbi:MAG: TetR family transcriptional regulator C-terminal domain-containing protein [Actinomycetota bacterium]|nr:TetR family transcriptional regulator C-terminal domain-containing protein [Actinomycetota bacterium]